MMLWLCCTVLQPSYPSPTYRLDFAAELDPVVHAGIRQRHVKAHVLCRKLLVLKHHALAFTLRQVLQERGVLHTADTGGRGIMASSPYHTDFLYYYCYIFLLLSNVPSAPRP